MRVTLFTVAILLACCMYTDAWRSGRRSYLPRPRPIPVPRPTYPRPIPLPRPTFPRPSPTFPGRRYKRSDDQNEQQLYNVELQANPCDFFTYDVDGNGGIALKEMHAIFGNNKMALNLFLDLDYNENGVIEAEEFAEQASQFISACADIVTDDDLDTEDED
ncbi:uncharacterized protein LOC132736450 [Ruditapes philippinarum]|uniref:uncharacterized protein LOC132736450 n=1 Tax=Ruditapes philippinarum TaxID=129788 RepID=UPI00295A6DA7|nr:uncharacterized protein LOC132736450 [Ruditapes philippinarum]